MTGFGSGWCLDVIGDVTLGSEGTLDVGGTSGSGALTGGVGTGNSGCQFVLKTGNVIKNKFTTRITLTYPTS